MAVASIVVISSSATSKASRVSDAIATVRAEGSGALGGEAMGANAARARYLVCER